MRTSNILLGLSLVLLYGCQPEPAAQQAAAPVVSEAAQVAPVQQAESAPVEEAAQSAVAETPAQQAAAPVASEAAKSAPARQAKSALVAEAAQPAVAKMPALTVPVQVIDTPATQTGPAPVAAEVKPETPPEPVVSEADAMQLAKKNNCFACHAVGKKVVGPSFKDIAAKYRSNPDAETMLMGRIAKGGSGVWGGMVMPPHTKISEADRRILAKLVLSSK